MISSTLSSLVDALHHPKFPSPQSVQTNKDIVPKTVQSETVTNIWSRQTHGKKMRIVKYSIKNKWFRNIVHNDILNMLTYERPAHEGLDQSHHKKISILTLRRALPCDKLLQTNKNCLSHPNVHKIFNLEI